MKKTLALLLCAASMLALLAGCGSKSTDDKAPAANGGETASTEKADYPTSPITVIIPYSPGGGSDILTRKIMEYIELPNNQKLVAVNVEGASGFTGAMQAFNSKNDGYTILAHNPMDVVSYSLSGTTDVELWDELETVCGIVDDFNVLVTNPQSGWTTLEEALEYIKANPGTVKVGNTGSNNCNMADCLRTLDALGIRDDVVVVPYDGGAENKTALMGNHVQLSVNSCADIQSAITSGDHIALLTVGDRRAKFLPDTPCTAELGYDVVTTKPRGWYAPAGMSQEQLADRLGVTRQSVSKWEGGTAMPELVKLISLSELFGVSVDYLVKDWMEEPDNPCGGSGEISSKQADRLEKKVDELTNYVKGRVYRYDSKTRIFGLPLVSIRFGFVRNGKLSMDNTAKGIIAIGNCAIGVVAIGIVGVGLFTFGVLAMGMLSLGIVAGGLAAFGVAALGYLALGVSAVGVYAGGVAAIAAKIAVAVSSVAPTAVGEFASGSHVLLWGDGLTAPEVQTFLLEHHPDLWRPLLRLLTEIGAHIK